MITININGKRITLEKPVTILEAARKNGIDIPALCNHPALELWGGCRMCLVEIEKMPRLQTSCTVTAADGMTVYTETPEVVAARKAVLEFLLINHPLECPTCDKAGVCKLQDLTMRYGAVAGRFEEGKRTFPENVDDPVIVRNMERCIMCTRCVRMCDGVQGAFAIGVVNKGARSHVEPFSGGRYNCEYCGNCLSVCPVGAIMSRLHRYTYRPWQMDKTVRTICSFCGVGCTLLLEVRNGAIQKVSPEFGAGVNNGLLCGRGMFGYGYVGSPERLKTPLIKKNGRLEPASWDEALALTASWLLKIKTIHGGAAIGAVAGGRCTNEENYIFQKLLRAGFGSNNIDSVARLGLLNAQNLLEGIFGQGAAANAISGIPHSDAVLTVACDPTQTNPVMGLQVRAAAKAGKKVITIGHALGLRRHRTHSLQAAFGTEGILLAGLLRELLRIFKKLPGENPGLEAAISGFILPGLEEVELLSGVSPAKISEAASALKEVSTSSIIAGRELAASMDARRNFMLLAAIGYILNSRFFLISEHPNEQGLIDMGCAPDILPGGRPLGLQTFRERYEKEWGVKLDPAPGLTLMEMFEQAGGPIKAMYIMGENPAFNLPGRRSVKKALEKLDFLVVQDIFMTETAAMADVVLPALAWSEKDGTYTNLEKRMQKLEKAVEKPIHTGNMPIQDENMEDWRILAAIGKRAGINMPYMSSSDIIDEISRLSPLHSGLGYEDLPEGGMMWPYKGKPLGMGGRMPSLPPLRAAAPLDSSYEKGGQAFVPMLVLEKSLFHSGTLSRHSGALLDIMGMAEARMSPETGGGLGVEEGAMVKISTAGGELSLKVKLEEGLPAGAIFAGNNFREAGALGLFGYELEPESKTPVLKVAGLKVERSS